MTERTEEAMAAEESGARSSFDIGGAIFGWLYNRFVGE